MNKIGFLLAIGAMAATASAEQISESQAMAVATKYMQLEQPNRQLVPAPRTATASSAAPYYVFNSSDGKGFIIVSGDDELTEIVGYSTDGFFDTANIPANAQAWLNKYADYVARVQSGDAVARKVQVSTLAETIVEPLVTTRWNQDAPYNNMCPIDRNYNRRSVTGCGATAMAQVMKYWEWPVQGQGEHQNANDPSLEVDFSESVYDWDNMLDTYNSLSSQTAQDAVAKLMYDCGVSIDMSYSYVASGAYDSDIAIALGTYFGYKAQTYLRDAYTVNAFRELIKSELDNARPVLFGGQGTVGGHEYVVDGYDSNDFLHINWGWGGASDGFYDMELCVRYLSGLGHRRIGLLMNHSRQEEEASMEQRYQGFLRAMKPCRLEKPESYVGFNSDGTLSENLDRLLAKEITALIVLPGDFGLSVYGELLHRNFRMPSDISLLSWSFPGVLENLYPRITVLEQNYKQWAEVSCDLLEKKWRGEEVRTPLFVRGKLLKRDSCGPVPCR